MDSDIDQIIDILSENYDFLPSYFYYFDNLNVSKLKKLFNNKISKIVIVINYNENFQMFFAKIDTITVMTSNNEVEYTLNISQEDYINVIINDSGFCQINIIGKNKYKITNLLYVVKNKKETKKANSLKIFF